MTTTNLPPITWCTRCLYPSSSAVPLEFDADGVCSGCRVHDQKKRIDWDERLEWLLDDVEPFRSSSGYECVIGVSGGKDSYFQTHFVKEKLGLNPLLVTYNGNNYLDVGWRNLMRMKEVFKTDHIVVSPSLDMLIRMNRLGFRKTGDMNWHAHCGIFTLPMKLAVQHEIPLVFWGEHGFTDVGGMLSMNDFPEFTYRYRRDQGLRGYDWWDFVDDEEDPIGEYELECYKYPSDEAVERVGLRGIFIGNFDPWDANAHAETGDGALRMGALACAIRAHLSAHVEPRRPLRERRPRLSEIHQVWVRARHRPRKQGHSRGLSGARRGRRAGPPIRPRAPLRS